MSRCARIKEGGERCKARAMEGSTYCYNHEPSRAEERKRHARRGGERGGNGRPGQPELRAIRREVRGVIEAVESRTLDESRGRAVLQGYRVLLQAVEAERKVIETDDLLVRLEEIERRQTGRSGPRKTN
jgi:hypothetical protein